MLKPCMCVYAAMTCHTLLALHSSVVYIKHAVHSFMVTWPHRQKYLGFKDFKVWIGKQNFLEIFSGLAYLPSKFTSPGGTAECICLAIKQGSSILHAKHLLWCEFNLGSDCCTLIDINASCGRMLPASYYNSLIHTACLEEK